jgi:hypothetical protein
VLYPCLNVDLNSKINIFSQFKVRILEMFSEQADTALIIISFIYMGLTVLKYLPGWYRRIRRLCKNNLASKYGVGSWAVITGSSDGIGKAFAEQLTKYGLNIILIARNKTKLDGVATELTKLNSKVQTRVVVADFNNSTDLKFYEEIYS